MAAGKLVVLLRVSLTGVQLLPPPFPPLTTSAPHDFTAPPMPGRLLVESQTPDPDAVFESYALELYGPPSTPPDPLMPATPAAPGPPRPPKIWLSRITRLAFEPET